MISPFVMLNNNKTEWSSEDPEEDGDEVDEFLPQRNTPLSQKKQATSKVQSQSKSKEPPTVLRQATQWITHQMRPIAEYYHIEAGRPLGEPGQFGTAYACWKHPTAFEKKSPEWKPELRCVKEINKARFHMITNKKEREKVFGTLAREIGFLKKLNHENIVQLYDVYESRNQIHLIMEYLPGGELFDRIADKEDGYSEKDAANILHQILSALDYMHDRDIVHLDLKPENILFIDKDSEKIKLIDFGMSRMAPRFAKLRDRVGTTAYMAPEVFTGQYSKAADVWSTGIILYCMVFGYPPFHMDEDAEEELVFAAADKAIEKQVVEKGFTPKIKPGFGPWFPKDIPISDALMGLIGKMLASKVKNRWTVKECLDSPWLRGQLSDKSMPKIVREGLQKFNRHCKFKVAVSKMFMNVIDAAHISEIEEFFNKLDANGDGIITCEEFVNGMKKHYQSNLSTQKLVEMFENADIDGSQGLTIDELITVAAHRALIDEDERLFDVFQELDEDGDGVITQDELLAAARDQKRKGNQRVKTLFIASATNEIAKHLDGEGKIDYEAFLRLIHPAFSEEMTLQEWESQATVSTRVRSSTFDVDISQLSLDIIKPKSQKSRFLDVNIAQSTPQQKKAPTRTMFSSKSSSKRSVTLSAEDQKELEVLRHSKQQWESDKKKYEEKIKQLENEIEQVRKKYETKLLEKIESQGNVIKDVKSIREEWDEKYQSRLAKFDERIDAKDEIISRKDALIQDLQERITNKSAQIDSLGDQLFQKESECDGLQGLLEDAIQSKMQSLRRMEEFMMAQKQNQNVNNLKAKQNGQNNGNHNKEKRKTNHLSMMNFPGFGFK